MKYLKIKAISEDDVDRQMAKKGYVYKLIPLGKYDGFDPLYVKTKEDVKMWRSKPPEKDMKFKIEIL